MFYRSRNQSQNRNSRFNRFGGRGNNFRRQGRGRTQAIDQSHYVRQGTPQIASEEYKAAHAFDDFSIDSRLKNNIRNRGYTTPTPIQDQTISHILEGRDVVGIANTGTGKTAAFLIPLIQKILLNPRERVLIVIPTRELAVQIEEELKAISQSFSIYSTLCIGGMSMYRQTDQLRRNPHMVIGTPGRLKDLIQQRKLNLFLFQTIVLDEVDRMVDIGFIDDIRYMISLLPVARQSLFFSATISPQVTGIIQTFLKDPITVSVKKTETVQNIDQDVIRVKDKSEKIEKLQTMLRAPEFKKVLIFGRTKWGVERLSKSLQQNGFQAASIHGNKSQSQRLRALSQFKGNQLQVLVATDIAARGLDIADVSHVINFDEPASYTDYVHRIGRTGRAQKSGKAFTFVG